jgi:hypothetical protein
MEPSYHRPMGNRRKFIKKLSLFSTSPLILSMATLGSSSLLTGCASIDEYLITNPSDLTDYVVIVGGGITGLYAAYQLKKRKIPFRIFESSHYLGGKFRSDGDYEFGAFEFLNTDKNFLALTKDLNVKIEKIDSKNWIFKNGSQDLISRLTDRVSGVLPNQQIKLNYQLIGLSQNVSSFKLVFATNKSDKSYSTQNLLLALPARQLLDVKGLDAEFYNTGDRLVHTKTIRVVLSSQKLGLRTTTIKNRNFEKLGVACSVQLLRGLVYITMSGDPKLPQFPNEIELIQIWIAENVFGKAPGWLTLDAGQIYIWQTDSVNEPIKFTGNSHRQIISDGLTVVQSRVENLLIAVNDQIDQFL